MYEHKKSLHVFIYFMVAVVSFLFGWQATIFGFLGEASVENNNNHENSDVIEIEQLEDSVDLSLFWSVWEELEEKYVDVEKLDEQNMAHGAIKGFVDSLGDPYTVFMTAEESSEFNDSLEGTLEGIGAELTVEDHNLVVVSPLRDSPAEKAGLIPGDIIYMIDDQVSSEMTLFDAIMSIRGERGTTVTLTIIRENLGDAFDVSIVRDSIDIESVTVEKLDENIIYLSVNQFNDKTTNEFGQAISEMILDEPDGMIIDLRYNGGGYLDIAVELLSYILPSDTVAVSIDQRDMDEDFMYTNGNPKVLNVPLVVLVNEGSASASEIVAGAVQDHERGIMMGTQTFGKGSVQEVDTFSDGSSIRMTIAEWNTPDGRNINDVGLTPDIIVEITEEDILNEYDAQREAAIEYLVGL